MSTSTQRSLLVCTLVLGATACGGDDEEFTPAPPFENPGHVATWATASSAVGVYSHAYQHIAVADGQGSYADADCPVIEDDGTTWSATGGCTDSRNEEWTGSATVVRNGGDRELTFDDFNGVSGTVNVREIEVERHEFEVELDIGGFTTIDYMGSVQGGYNTRTLWNGSGTVTRDGFIAPNGEVEASTLDEVIDNDVCAGQPVSGTTTLKSGEDTAVITYDGETDCDDEKQAALAVNDEDRGFVEGVNCSAAPRGSAVGAAGVPLLLALGWWRARARRRSSEAGFRPCGARVRSAAPDRQGLQAR